VTDIEPDAEVAELAADALGIIRERGWRQHALWHNGETEDDPQPYDGGSVCLIGAAMVARDITQVGDILTPAGFRLAKAITQMVLEEEPVFDGWLITCEVSGWNDKPARTQAEVEKVLDEIATKYRPDEAPGGSL
jgi:hypothetical protein